MVEPGTAIIVSSFVRSSFVTLLSTPRAFFTGIDLGIPCCTPLLTYKYCVCLSVDSAFFLENTVVREGKIIRS